MPSRSQKQHNLMAAAAHNSEFAKRKNIDPEAAKEFLAADKEAGLWQKSDVESKPKSKKKP